MIALIQYTMAVGEVMLSFLKFLVSNSSTETVNVGEIFPQKIEDMTGQLPW